MTHLLSPARGSRLRKMWQVTAAYLAGGLTTLLAVAELYDEFGFPEGTPRFVAALLAGGLPVAVLAGWVLDVRRNRRDDARGEEEETAPGGRATASSEDEEDRASIVVLPFENLSPDPENAYFADGLTHEIISDLARLPGLRVISRTSAMQYRGSERSIPEIARDLRVRYVLEGSVRKAGDAIRVTVQLVEAVTDDPLWSEKFGGTLADVFGIQERISGRIVDACELSLSGDDVERLVQRREEDPRVLELLMKVRHEIWRGTPEGFSRAELLLDSASGLVKESASLLAMRAELLFQSVNFGLSTDESRTEKAEALARKAIAMDDRCVQAYTTLTWILGGRKGEVGEGFRLLRKAYSLDPADTQVQVGVLFVCAILGMGDDDELDRAVEEVAARDPLSPLAHLGGWISLALRGRHDEALAAGLRAFELDQSVMYRVFPALSLIELDRGAEAMELLAPLVEKKSEGGYHDLCVAIHHALRGDEDAAREWITPQVVQWAGPDGQYSWHVAQAYALTGDDEATLHWIERAVENGFWNYRYLSSEERLFERLRAHPRFLDLIGRARASVESLDLSASDLWEERS